MRTYQALCILFTLVYTKGVLDRLGLPDFWSKLIVEFGVLLVILPILKKSRWKSAPGWAFVAIFTILTIISGMLSGDGPYLSLLYFRMTAYAYLVFWAVWNADLSGREVWRINRLILMLWLLQIAASAFELFVLGERVEAHVGTITSGGGGPATAFPLFALAYFMAFYFYYKRSWKVVLLGLAFGIVAYASGKRAIFFYMPAIYALAIVWYCVREKSFSGFGRMIVPAVVFILILPLFIFGLTTSKRFTYLQGAGIVETVVVAFEVAKEYETRVGQGWVTFGRSATSMMVFQNITSGPFDKYFTGHGPASLMMHGEKRAGESEGIAYGIVGWARDTLSIGWPAMIAHVAFYIFLWRKLYRRRDVIKNSYFNALHFGAHLGFAVYFLLYFTHLDAFAMAGWLTFVQVYVVALLLSPKHKCLLQAETFRKKVVRRNPVATVAGHLRPELSREAR